MNFGREFFFNHPCLSGQKLHCKPETRGLQVEWVMMSIHILPLNPPNQICTKFVPIFDQISPVLAGLGGESASEMDFFLTIPPPPPFNTLFTPLQIHFLQNSTPLPIHFLPPILIHFLSPFLIPFFTLTPFPPSMSTLPSVANPFSVNIEIAKIWFQNS